MAGNDDTLDRLASNGAGGDVRRSGCAAGGVGIGASRLANAWRSASALFAGVDDGALDCDVLADKPAAPATAAAEMPVGIGTAGLLEVTTGAGVGWGTGLDGALGMRAGD